MGPFVKAAELAPVGSHYLLNSYPEFLKVVKQMFGPVDKTDAQMDVLLDLRMRGSGSAAFMEMVNRFRVAVSMTENSNQMLRRVFLRACPQDIKAKITRREGYQTCTIRRLVAFAIQEEARLRQLNAD